MADVVKFVPAVLLGAGVLLISGLRDQQRVPPRAPMARVAVAAPGYQVKEVIVPEAERKIAGMSDYTMRFFQRDSTDPGFSVYVGYYDYQVQGKTIHSPKNCLPGAGWEPVQSGTRWLAMPGVMPGVDSVPVNRYYLAKEGAKALVYYWYQGRGRVEANEYKVKWNLLRDAGVFGRTEEALVRIVVPIHPAVLRDPAKLKVAQDAADSLATGVARQLVPGVNQVLPTPPQG